MKDVVQYSIDLLDVVDGISAEKLKKALEDAGFVVLGIGWKATWDEDAYNKGKLPKSWD